MPAPLAFFATDAEAARLESQGLAAQGMDRVLALVHLAWQLRQRDTARALALAEEAESVLAGMPWAHAEQRTITARLSLLRAEAKWLFSELDAARQLAESALQAFTELGDGRTEAIGRADAHWLLACLAFDAGQGQAAREALEAMARAAEAHDRVRFVVAQSTLAREAAFKEVAAGMRIWETHLGADEGALHPVAVSAIEDFKGLVASLHSDHVQSIRHKTIAYTLALDTGQRRRAIIAATNIGGSFGNLNDHHAALDWMQRGLELARASGWPARIGGALMQTAETLRCLRRHDAAAALLEEALALLEPLSASRNYAIALHYLADVELDRKRYGPALSTFRALEQRALALDAADLLGVAKRGQAKAMLELGEPEAALQAATAAMSGARSDPLRQIAALRVLAEIHARHALPPPEGMTAHSAAMHYLNKVLEIGASIENYTPPGDLFEALAREHAHAGEMAEAYRLVLMAMEVSERTHTVEASSRASAMHISHETEKARAESEHQRQMAAAHAQRAEALELHNATLKRLSEAGRRLTGHLDTNAICTALEQHVQSLVPGSCFAVSLGDGRRDALVPVLDARTLLSGAEAPNEADLREHWLSRCMAERREVVWPARQQAGMAGGQWMAAPLMVGERLLGVMQLRSHPAGTFTEQDTAVFATLGAYAAVALVNAETQLLLVEQNLLLERLSTSDSLTGLYNRLHLDRVLQEERSRHARYGSALSIVLLDIDHFKAVNDTHGHQVGDQVLVHVANVLRQGSRTMDIVGRWGGEEFLIICRETGAEGAMVLAEKLRQLLAAHAFPVVGSKTGSFGVATLGEHASLEALIASADAALYRAKQAGRNRVVYGG